MSDHGQPSVPRIKQPAKLAAAQARIEAATAQYLQGGGTITRLDNKGSPVKHLSWKEEAARTKAAGLSYVSERGHLVLRDEPKPTPARAHLARQESMKKARQTRSAANAEQRAKLAPRVRVLAECDWTTGQIARFFEVAPGTIRRIGRDHGIPLNTDKGAMPAKEAK